MKINIEILDSAYIYAPKEIDELNTKELVPKMLTRRRLTRSAKIAIYLASQVNFIEGRIVYGNNYAEPSSTAKILESINNNEQISPTIFQNSVNNTAVSYLSIINENKAEISTISSGDKTSLNVLKAGAIKALDGDTILLIVCETLNIPRIEELNSCIDILESGVALKIKVTQDKANIKYDDTKNLYNFPKSIISMLNVAKKYDKTKANIVEINI